MVSELPFDSLKKAVDPDHFSFETTENVTPLADNLGQERAGSALAFGLGIKTPGYNIFALGPPGTNKETMVENHTRKMATTEDVPPDWCYVYDFADERHPRAISLPAGKGAEFKKDMAEMISDARTEIPKAFESEEYEARRTTTMSKFESERDKRLAEAQNEAAQLGFKVELTLAGIATVPTMGGHELQPDEFSRLPEGVRDDLQKKNEQLQTDIHQVLHQVREMEKKTKDEMQKLDKEITIFAVGHLLDALRDKYQTFDAVTKYLNDVQADIVEHLEDFKKSEKSASPIPGLELPTQEPSFTRYTVNLLVDNSKTEGAPVIVENNPNYFNLFGRIEYEPRMGATTTDFTMIKAGSLLRAGGGYVIVQAYDALTQFMVWDSIKRMVRSGRIRIENVGEQFRIFPAATLEPEPIPVDVKIILVGSPFIYYVLYQLDEDFRRIFRVKADFGVDMDRTPETQGEYARYIAARVTDEGFRPFDRTAVAKLIEHSSWLADDQRKLSTRFQLITDLMAEANYWAVEGHRETVTAQDVVKAIEQKIYRSNMIEERLQEFMRDNVLMIDTSGEVTGQINGLSVSQVGDYMFGRPNRITTRTFVGRKGVVNVEREVKMSGPIHNKGVLILSGYLSGKYNTAGPLSMNATVTFEQTYEEIEGDSASSAELYCILSSLADLPINQAIATTGSVNQRGEIQAIGGVNAKIEGYFDLAEAKGLTGQQGVIIPEANNRNLMLKDRVVDAVKDGKFHIWPVKTIDEGVSILTGTPAGERGPTGEFPPGTVNFMVEEKLRRFQKTLEAAEGKRAGEEKAA